MVLLPGHFLLRCDNNWLVRKQHAEIFESIEPWYTVNSTNINQCHVFSYISFFCRMFFFSFVFWEHQILLKFMKYYVIVSRTLFEYRLHGCDVLFPQKYVGQCEHKLFFPTFGFVFLFHKTSLKVNIHNFHVVIELLEISNSYCWTEKRIKMNEKFRIFEVDRFSWVFFLQMENLLYDKKKPQNITCVMCRNGNIRVRAKKSLV